MANGNEPEQPRASSTPDTSARSDPPGAADSVGAFGDAQTMPDQQPGPRPRESTALVRAEITSAGGGRHEMPAASGPSTASAATAAPEHRPPVVLAAPDPQGRQVTARLMIADGGDGRRLRIELSPAELGRVEVSLRLDDRGNAAALFTVDRPETLQLLQRDARAVTELLATAGFSVDQGGLGFLLRDGAGDMGRPGQQPQAGPAPRPRPGSRAANADHPTLSAAWSSRGLLDLHV
jgi:flagellar hook-length control protein FliK